MHHKTCSKCKKPKKLTEFSKHKSNKDGFQFHCKVCSAAYGKAYYENNKERVVAGQNAWKEANKESVAAGQKAWKKANPDKVNSYTAKRRARKLAQTPDLTAEESAKVEHYYWMTKDLQAVTGEYYEVDHVVALVNGGLHHPDNLQVLPRDMNRSKGST